MCAAIIPGRLCCHELAHPSVAPKSALSIQTKKKILDEIIKIFCSEIYKENGEQDFPRKGGS